MERFARFFEGFQQDLKAYVYWCIVFAIFRFAFIAIYSSQIEGLLTADVMQAMWLGLRLSLKTTGMLVLVGVVFATLPSVVFKKWKADKIRYAWHSLALIFFSILFFARIPYYQIFNNAFDMMVINGMHDDKYAILMTAINEYQMLWRLPTAVVVGIVLAFCLKLVLKTSVIKFAGLRTKKIVVIATILFIPVFWVFTRFGGAFIYAKAINIDSAARLKSHLLNEAILDDGQALYRVYLMKRKLVKDINVNITVDELKKKIAAVGGNPNAKTIDEAFIHRVSSPKIGQQPNNVCLIIGESFGLWPFLPQFKDLGLVEETTKLRNSKYGFAIENMLSAGTGTMPVLNVLLTGLPTTGIYENYQPNSFNTKYQMGIGYIMKKMGYRTIFWYGGFSGWQNLKKMALAQSFDEFRCADEFVYTGGNSWGCPDEVLFDYVSKYVDKQSNEKVFHLILTCSNHPSYTVDVDSKGFNRKDIINKLPDSIKDEGRKIDELGHMWYMDQEIGKFVRRTEKVDPSTLFVIVGDHSERFDFNKEQNIKTKSAIPCIFYGQGINKKIFNGVKVGVHNQIAGTIAELIAPAGFEYGSMMGNMFIEKEVYNHYLCADETGIKRLGPNTNLNKIAADARSIAIWRALKEK